MGSKSSAPDPVSTSVKQNQIDQTNTTGPFGSSSYAQTGTNADGVPITTQTTSLSPQLQALYDQVGEANPAISPSNLSNEFNQQQQASYGSQEAYLQPQQQQQTAQLKDQLAQQGITQDSNPTAYDNAMTLNNNNQTFANQQAYDSSYSTGLAGEGQLFNQGVQSSNLPVSQLATLYGLSGNGSQSGSSTLAQLEQQQYQGNLASQNNTDSGLVSLGSAAMMAFALA